MAKLIMEEWVVAISTLRTIVVTPLISAFFGDRDRNIKSWADDISAAGIPWFYWLILPNEDPRSDWDDEVDIVGVNWDALKDAAANTASYESAFDFSEWLL